MAFSYVAQLRDAVVTDLIAQYVNETTLTARGDLPDESVFVMSIEDALDPQQDRLVRIARVGDLVQLGKDRPTAVRLGEPLYRSSTITARYDLITEAQTAAAFVVEQINLLVTEYQTYLTAFKAVPAQVIALPQAAIGVLQPAIDAYVAKKAEREAQSAQLASLQASCAATSAELAAKNATVAALEAAETAIRSALAGLSSTLNVGRAFLDAHNTYAGIVGSTLGAWTVQRAAVSAIPQAAMDLFLRDSVGSLSISHTGVTAAASAAYASELNQVTAQALRATSELQALQATLGTAKGEAATLSTASAACATSVANAAAQESALLAQEAALLAEVQRLCPTFTP